ncbi:MAG: nucleotidyltransferase family protein [Candidatus Bathyarchaeota archaeon]|nr:nucleotidyltransferase family protein [Candidatus Bathyarchaeota archaeon]
MSQAALQVMKTIGIPSICRGNPPIDSSPQTLHSASLNKVVLLYLESLVKCGKIDPQDTELKALRERQQKILQLAAFLGDLFERKSISYVVMKTLRPFPYTGADVDVIVGNPKGFSAAVRILQENGFLLLGNDLYSATLFREDFDANVDLQLEVSVSGLPYLDKKALLLHSYTYEFNGVSIKTLKPYAEVTVIASHAFYKEHMYTLADFYTTALSINQDNYVDLCKLAQKTNSTTPLSVLLSWTQNVSTQILHTHLSAVDDALKILGGHALAHLLPQEMMFPLKFPKSFVLLTLAHKISTDSNVRSSLPAALSSSFSQKQLRALLFHFTRESY